MDSDIRTPVRVNAREGAYGKTGAAAHVMNVTRGTTQVFLSTLLLRPKTRFVQLRSPTGCATARK